MKSLRRQAGVALITAVLIVALATILAVSVGFKGYLGQRRTATTFALDQAYQVALGGEAWAADALKRDITQSQGGGGRGGSGGGEGGGGGQGGSGGQTGGGQTGGGQTDDFTDVWAQPIPPIPVDGGEFEGVLEDMQGRFNLNNLVMIDQTRTFVVDPKAVARLERLLELVKIDKKWANLIADFIDSDANPQFPDGAEDPTYTGLNPPYRTANMPITRTSELLAVNGFGQQNFRRLEPLVAALPVGTKLNLCTAPAEVLDSLLGPGQSQYTRSRESTAKLREIGCHPTTENFNKGLGALDEKEKMELGKVIGTTSDYFQSTIFVTIGTTQFTLYSLLYRNQMGMVRPTLRSFGTP
jgi:general secretion pathway protein K